MKLIIDNISKCYKGDFWALKNVSIEIEKGILGLLGPNGAGKSTLMRIISTITKPTTGNITLDGINIVNSPDYIREKLGYLPQDFGVYPNLNTFEFLSYLAASRGLSGKSTKKRINELISLVNLTDSIKRPLGTFSGGMKQRVGIAQALLNDPEVIIVDEPTAGLDIEERARFRNLLTELSGERIVILSSHIASDIEASATDIAIIKKGELIIHRNPEDLLNIVSDKVWDLTIPGKDLDKIKNKYIVSNIIRTEKGIKIKIVSDLKPEENAIRSIPSLEEAYLCLLNNKSDK